MSKETIPPFEVKLQEFSDLSPQEAAVASNNGSGKDIANYIRINRYGTTITLESDAMEQEDAKFTRDLSWITSSLRNAYESGLHDGGVKVALKIMEVQ